MNPFIRLLYALLIAAATVTFIGVGIYTFYPAPQQPAYPQQIVPVDKNVSASVDNSASTEYQEAYDNYQADQKTYSRNVSIIVSVLAVAVFAIAIYVRQRADIIGEGLSFGSIGTTIYGVITASIADDRVMRFIAVTLFLASAILVVYREFNQVPTKAAKGKK